VEELYKLAACLLSWFVTLHPFLDGNGRLGKLLANFILSGVTPFPIPFYVEDGVHSREVYVAALMAARDYSDPRMTWFRPPCDLLALIIEVAWLTWRNLKKRVES
jgi:hypothetical protein